MRRDNRPTKTKLMAYLGGTKSFKWFSIRSVKQEKLNQISDYINSEENKDKKPAQLRKEVLEKFGLHIDVINTQKQNR